ncbi:unnamed protein product, partial [Cyprideis torosa]
ATEDLVAEEVSAAWEAATEAVTVDPVVEVVFEETVSVEVTEDTVATEDPAAKPDFEEAMDGDTAEIAKEETHWQTLQDFLEKRKDWGSPFWSSLVRENRVDVIVMVDIFIIVDIQSIGVIVATLKRSPGWHLLLSLDDDLYERAAAASKEGKGKETPLKIAVVSGLCRCKGWEGNTLTLTQEVAGPVDEINAGHLTCNQAGCNRARLFSRASCFSPFWPEWSGGNGARSPASADGDRVFGPEPMSGWEGLSGEMGQWRSGKPLNEHNFTGLLSPHSSNGLMIVLNQGNTHRAFIQLTRDNPPLTRQSSTLDEIHFQNRQMMSSKEGFETAGWLDISAASAATPGCLAPAIPSSLLLVICTNENRGLALSHRVLLMSGLAIVLFVLLVFLNTDHSKAECSLPGTLVNMGMMQMGKTQTVEYRRTGGRILFGIFGPRKKKRFTVTVEHPFTVEGVQIWLKTDKFPPLLEIQKIVKEDGNNDVRSISCIAFNEQKYPTHSSSKIPIAIQQVALESEVFTEHSMYGTTRTWVGKPTLKFTCQDLVQLGDLDGDYWISLKAFNAIIPPPVVEIYNSNELMIESYPLDQIVATFGSTTLRLPGNIGCRSFLVKVRCASVEMLGDGQSKWYFLPSPSENNSLLIPAIDPPTLMISSSQPMNSKQDPFSNLEDVRIDIISPRENNTPQLLICTQQECSKDRKEGQLYDLRFKIASKAANGELLESCFTSIPPQQMPQLKFSLTFKNTVAVSFRNLSDVTKQNAAFTSEKGNIVIGPTKIHSTEFVPSALDLLSPSEIPEQPEEVIGSIGIQWSQQSIVYQRLELQILLQDLASAERFHWCSFNESTSVIRWKFSGVDDSCNIEFTVRYAYQKDNEQKLMVIKTRGVFEELNSTFHFGIHIGTVFPAAGQHMDGMLIFNVSLTDIPNKESSCSVIHNLAGPSRSMVSSSSDFSRPADFDI